jgi:hypothetical protein
MYKCLLSYIKLSPNFEHPTNFTILTKFNKIEPSIGLSRVRTSKSASDNPTDVRRTACHPPLHLAVGLGGRHGGQPSDHRSPAPTVGCKADGRSVRRWGWRTAWRIPPPGPSAKGRPPGAVRQSPSARGRPPSQNFGTP